MIHQIKFEGMTPSALSHITSIIPQKFVEADKLKDDFGYDVYLNSEKLIIIINGSQVSITFENKVAHIDIYDFVRLEVM